MHSSESVRSGQAFSKGLCTGPHGWIALPCEPYRGLDGRFHQDFVDDESLGHLEPLSLSMLILLLFWSRGGEFVGDHLLPIANLRRGTVTRAEATAALLDLEAHEVVEIGVLREDFARVRILDPYRSWKRDEAYRFIPKYVKAEVVASGPCRHCGATEDLCVDHVRPVARGGTSERSNLQPLCRRCNSSKGARFVG